jgi:hypothetical protein
MGFFIISVLISPIAVLFNSDFTSIYNILPSNNNLNQSKWEEIKNEGEEIKGEHRSYLDDYYKSILADRITRIVSLDFPDIKKNISLELDKDYQIEQLDINLLNKDVQNIKIPPIEIGNEEKDKNRYIDKKSDLNNNDLSQLKQRLSQVLQVPESLIEITLRGAN